MASQSTSERASQSQPFRENGQQQRALGWTGAKNGMPGGKKLWRQMVVGFVCAACLGIIMLILGSVFIGDAIERDASITVMLCVMGLVCGLIILVGTAFLGRLFISRKWRVQEGRQPIHHPPEACFHTCSIIYTPSQDQLNGPPFPDPPPAYEMVIFPQHHRPSFDHNVAGCIEVNDSSGRTIHQPIMMCPPKYSAASAQPPNYSVATAPLPPYGDPV